MLDPAQWLWRSRVALLLSQCVRLRDHWSLADEPTYRLTKAGSYSICMGGVAEMDSDLPPRATLPMR